MRWTALTVLCGLMAAPTALKASECFQLAEAPAAKLHHAAFKLNDDEVGIRFIGHSTYMIQSPEGLRVGTDWSGDFGYRMEALPHVATMNHAHETHWTAYPSEEIEHVLEGWSKDGKPRRHFLRLGETLIRNIPTDIRGGEWGDEPFGNSIFVFEMAGLCIGHVGHLHHVLTEEHYALLGRLDVIMVPIDGSHTIDVNDLVPMLERLKVSVVLPMHSFGRFSVARFGKLMAEAGFEVKALPDNDLVLTMKTLPKLPTVFMPKGV